MKPIVLKEPQGKLICKICGKEENPFDWINENDMRKHQMCFSCNFWREILEKDKKRLPYTWCVIDGTHYMIEPDEPNAVFQGFDGAEFHIHFKDGHEIVTHNLWCQGEPDEHWRQYFPDNADFDWQWKRIGETKYLVPKGLPL